MGKQTCPNGHSWKTRFQPTAGERFCPKDGCGLPAEPTLKQRSNGAGLRAEAEPRVIADAHSRFSTLVCEWPCWFHGRRQGHTCWPRNETDPHHLVPADWIRQTYRDLPDVELADILYAPIIGVPLCRKAHEAVERRISEFIFWQELDPECIEFCKAIDAKHPGRPSMLERLKLESPVRGTGEVLS